MFTVRIVENSAVRLQVESTVSFDHPFFVMGSWIGCQACTAVTETAENVAPAVRVFERVNIIMPLGFVDPEWVGTEERLSRVTLVHGPPDAERQLLSMEYEEVVR